MTKSSALSPAVHEFFNMNLIVKMRRQAETSYCYPGRVEGSYNFNGGIVLDDFHSLLMCRSKGILMVASH